MKKNFWIILLFLSIITTLFFNNIIFTDLTYFQRDIVGQFKPWKVYTKNVLANVFVSGSSYLDFIPLWNHYNYCGTPLLANLQSQVFYPFSIIFYFMKDFVLAFKIFILIHFVLSGFFMYLLLSSKKIDFLSSIFGAILWAFNGFMISRIEFLSVIATIIWLPLIIYFDDKLVEEKNIYPAIYLGIIFALQFLAGHAQMWYYSIIYSFIYIIFLAIKSKSYTPILYFTISIIICVCLSAIQFLPTIEFFVNSVRRGSSTKLGLGFEDATLYSLNIKDFFNIFYPKYWQIKNFYSNNILQIPNYWLYNFYLGFIGTIVAVIGFVKYKNLGKKIFLSAIMLLIALFSMGKNSFFYKFVYSYIPFTRIFRYPSTSMYVLIFILCYLSGFGFYYLIQKFKIKKIFILLFILLIAELYVYKNKISLLLPKSITNVDSLSSLTILSNFNDIKDFRFALTPATQFLDIPVKGKTLFEAQKKFFNKLYGNINLEKQIYNFRGQDIELSNFYKFMNFVYSKESLESAIPYFAIANVKYILSIKEHRTKYTTLLHNDEIKIYQNNLVLPRIFFTKKFVFEKDITKSLEIMEKLNFNILNTIILHYPETNFDFLTKNNLYPKNEFYKISNTKFLPNKITFNTTVSNPTFITISQNYYPGWKCFVNQQPTKMFHSNIFMTSILVPQGSSQIELIFDPLSFKIGCILSLLTFLSLTILFFETSTNTVGGKIPYEKLF